MTNVRNIASDGTDLYVTDNQSSGAYLLKTLDFGGTASSAIGAILDPAPSGFVSLRGFTFGPGGTLYAYNGNGQRLIRIDPDDATTTRLTATSGVGVTVNNLRGRLASAGGVLYGTFATSTMTTADDGLYTLDKMTGVATFVGNGGQAGTYSDMLAFGNGPTLYGISGTTLYRINLSDGSLTSLGGIGGENLPSFFLAAVIAPVPEPGAVLGISALGLGVIRWVRRRAVRAYADADSLVAG